MFAEERKQRILAALNQNPAVRVSELGRALRVSAASVRRDLADLERTGLLKRTHGGAISARLASLELTLAEKEDRYQAQKAAIARLAVTFLKKGDTVFLDAGSTTRQIARELAHQHGLTVVTNALNIAWELASADVELVMTGGQVRRGILSQVGPIAEHAISAIHVDKLFLAANGVDLEKGATTPNLLEAQTKRAMIDRATEVILVADHTKFGRVTFSCICGLERIHRIITDDGVAPEMAAALGSLGIDVHLASIDVDAPFSRATDTGRP